MDTKQPTWELVENLGDVHPLDYGGYLIYRDTTGVYPEEGQKIIVDDSADRWEVYRFPLDRCKMVHGYLVPIHYEASWPHPLGNYDEWFHKTLSEVGQFVGQTKDDLESALCSENPLDRANAYQAIGDYHGYANLDSYPLVFTNRAEIEKQYPSFAR